MRRVSTIEVENFKSLVNFTIDLPKFSCLIGLNGAGKSTVLQLIDFLSQLVRGNMKGWLAERKWKSGDLKSKLTKKVNIEFCVRFCDEKGKPAGRWEAVFNPSKNQCTSERIDMLDFVLQTSSGVVKTFCVSQTRPPEWKDSESPITFSYEGSILSALKEELLPKSILDCKEILQSIKSLDLLAPEYLRQRTRESSGTLGLGGQNLSAVLHEMKQDERQEIIALLKRAYPHLQVLHAKSLRSGWKQIEIAEDYKGPESGFFPAMKTEARHINDGMLRMIAILTELQSKNRFLLFDEIENGINPELVEFVMNTLVKNPRQILVTTHSPMILNYLDDDVAREGVVYIYKNQNGATEAVPFFSIPSLQKKLEFMGPGEAFVDTNLTELSKEIASMNGGK